MHWKRSNSHCNGNRRDKQGTENIVILCFDRRFTKQNSVIRLKSYISPPQIFWPPPNFSAGYATGPVDARIA